MKLFIVKLLFPRSGTNRESQEVLKVLREKKGNLNIYNAMKARQFPAAGWTLCSTAISGVKNFQSHHVTCDVMSDWKLQTSLNGPCGELVTLSQDEYQLEGKSARIHGLLVKIIPAKHQHVRIVTVSMFEPFPRSSTGGSQDLLIQGKSGDHQSHQGSSSGDH